MLILKLILVIMTLPFWFPVFLMLIGITILVFGMFVLVFSLLSLCFIIWILKTLYSVHLRLVNARKTVLIELENGLNSKMSWWRFARLMFIKYKKQVKEIREFHKQYVESQNQEEKYDE